MVVEPSELSAYELYATARGIFQPHQSDLVAAYVPRYFAEIGATARFRSGWSLAEVATSAFPHYTATRATLELAEATLAGEPGSDLAAPVRRSVVDATDRLRRAVVSRRRFEGPDPS